ncbi:MAG: carboxymuconolactone decarboxylase family protein [Desmonostoc vinosum HA7617-LM4]|jgi:alkylhydroperoxidase/carboxymuconolactone decarboxylase family protein YurZ|nr:carboxymuconolactone decarboxylase family protein [Desmonostoc vinosum HA7617-LM4]
MSTHSLSPDLAAFRDSYASLFGSVPPLPAAKFEFSSDVDPEALRLAEQLRAHAFNSEIFDTKTTQLILFGILLAQGSPAARFHAIASRRAGATWEELHKVMELAAAVAALGPFNNGSALLNEL